jgi:hypothetical protein
MLSGCCCFAGLTLAFHMRCTIIPPFLDDNHTCGFSCLPESSCIDHCLESGHAGREVNKTRSIHLALHINTLACKGFDNDSDRGLSQLLVNSLS